MIGPGVAYDEAAARANADEAFPKLDGCHYTVKAYGPAFVASPDNL